MDALSSTTSNDTYAGAIDAWTALDVIDGGLGNDTLTVNSAAGTGVPVGATVTNVENIAISTAGAGYTMASIAIDNQQYDLDKLSAEAQAQLLSLQVTDQKIAQLQQDLAIAQTARNAYAQALGGLLPTAKKK